jgi:hypothetical protein
VGIIQFIRIEQQFSEVNGKGVGGQSMVPSALWKQMTQTRVLLFRKV